MVAALTRSCRFLMAERVSVASAIVCQPRSARAPQEQSQTQAQSESVEERGALVAARKPQRIGKAGERILMRALRRKKRMHDGCLSG